MATDYLAQFISTLAADPVASGLAIVLATFPLEDATAIVVGLLVSQAILSPIPALIALTTGTATGDLLLHLGGRYAGQTHWGQSLLNKRKIRQVLPRLRQANFWMVATARFVPGIRLPVYFGSGFLRLRFRNCAILIVLTCCISTPALFWLSVAGGNAAHDLIGDLTLIAMSAVPLLVLAAFIVRRFSERLDKRASRIHIFTEMEIRHI